MLEVEGLHAGYDNLRVLHGIDLSVPAGHLLAVIGANGAGKTTLLRAVSGLIRPSAGTVTVDGRAVDGLRPERIAAAGLAHVPENRLVFPSLTVADNLALGGWTRRRSATPADRDRVLDLFPRLRSRLAQPAGTLSGGEQQMVVIGRGLMAAPKVLVLDEPSVGLAPRLVAEIFAALGRLRDEQGQAILLVEQNARAAFRVADRVAVMDRGRVVTTGTPADLAGDDRVQSAYLGGGYQSTVD
ncbi:ABC transporter ATP-binding protein [Virgisporangium aurantiacum]|uniref:ABC transporter ATP-binding protein n=1 Tax=Virgisporangium aurantiacum TaxID=175570 RepID=A0A8J3ZG58_9ACTN|nr:ABC transporter ATP-binding protein [Virgisporangium aurantiacum]GIJ63271.1 ABC transporter ATP-binding protein [Virgisporangium aurantiacum]